jgi:acyl-coenzyme A synthetase/AMP-(fatty) acid ligase/acyl carrier protein
MITYLERLEDIIAKYPDRAAFADEKGLMTYRELDEASGRIYAYLKEKGIGREQLVLLILPRCKEAAAAMLGVLKAGAAFVMLEEGYPSERVAYIKKDTGCELVLDRSEYERIMDLGLEPLPRFEQSDPHDAAYIVYTSGSTGNPKGVLHEYGNLDQLAMTNPLKVEYEETTRGLMAPFYFVAAVMCFVNFTVMGATTYIIPHEMVRDFRRLKEYLLDKHIEGIFLPPSYIRLYQEPSPYLKLVSTGSEPANGLYYQGGHPVIRNFYTMTEAGFTVLSTDLDKAYETAPVGKPVLNDIDVHLVDEDGRRIEGAGQGELCFKNEYVRGYVNLPEKNVKAFRNGMYYSGDIARRDENGVYYIVGRIDDMIKINGNRIEPAEIEACVQDLTGLKKVIAKGFITEERSFICVYFLKEEARQLGVYADGGLNTDMGALMLKLPAYMIPSYYVGLDEFPLNQNGKIDKKQLKAPETKDYQRSYVAPANELEELAASCMAKVLKMDRVSADDDFYEIGGDSLKTIRLIAEFADRGYDISETDLFESRTPQRLAARTQGKLIAGDEEMKALEEQEEKRPHPLLQMQRSIAWKIKQDPDTTLANVPVLYQLKHDVDAERFARAVDKVFRHHPLLLTKMIQDEEGTILQKYDPELFEPVQIIKLTQEEFNHRKEELLSPMEFLNSRLYRNDIFVTEEHVYFFMDVHHVLVDGTSMNLITDQIYDCYMDPETELPGDYYYAILKSMADKIGGTQYREAEQYYHDLYEVKGEIDKCSCIIEPDLPGPDLECGVVIDPAAFVKKEGDGNLLFTTAAVIAAAKFNKTDRAMISWVHKGRDTFRKTCSTGAYARMLSLYLVIEENDTPQTLLQKAREQMAFASSHGCYTYLSHHQTPPVNTLQFVYQKNIMFRGKLGALIEDSLTVKKSTNQPISMFGLSITDNDGVPELLYTCAYSKGFYTKESMAYFRKLYNEAVEYLRQ